MGSFFAFLCAAPAGAAITDKDVSAMVNALKYVRALDRDNNNQIDINIIYNPGDENSLADARHIQSALVNNNVLKAGEIITKLVSVRDAANSKNADIYLFSSNMGSNYNQLINITKGKKVLTLSHDVACIENGYCAIVVNPSKTTPIYINEAILASSGFDVDSNFRYLAKRI